MTLVAAPEPTMALTKVAADAVTALIGGRHLADADAQWAVRFIHGRSADEHARVLGRRGKDVVEREARVVRAIARVTFPLRHAGDGHHDSTLQAIRPDLSAALFRVVADARGAERESAPLILVQAGGAAELSYRVPPGDWIVVGDDDTRDRLSVEAH